MRFKNEIKNEISNVYILLKCALKMQENAISESQRPKIKNIWGGGACPRTPYNCVVTRHYGLPLTKILATLLGLPCRNTDMSSLTVLPCNLTISYSNLTINKNPKTKKVKNHTLSQVSSLLNAVISLSNSNTE